MKQFNFIFLEHKKENHSSAQSDSISPDQLTTELSGHIHKKFVDYRALIMIQRPEYLKRMKEFLKTFWDFDVSKPKATKTVGEASNNVLLLNGIPGCGKTSLVCSFISACENMSQNIIVISYIVGGGPNSNDEEAMLRALGEKTNYVVWSVAKFTRKVQKYFAVVFNHT